MPDTASIAPGAPSLFAFPLLKWYETNGRELPWRGTRDPYRIWVSEVILQQTRIEQGRDYYLRFISQWPTVHALAAATEDEVLRLWQGLGYYSRARHMLTAARQVSALGDFPRTLQGLRSLKGVGAYTAAAIASMAFQLPVATVDGNVYRVLARHYGIHTPINTTAGQKLFAELAQALLPPQRAADFNQAMMDFGATQCTPKSPHCIECPLAESCVALRTDSITLLPIKERKTKIVSRQLTYIYIRCDGHTAIRRRPAGDIWQGLWEPLLLQAYGQLSPLLTQATPLRRGVRHILTHQRLTADFYLLCTDQRPTLPPDFFWIPESTLHNYAVPRLIDMMWECVASITE